MRSLRSWLVPLLLLGLFLAFRLVLVDADPPSHYPYGRFAQELIVEGPAKASEARRFGLFGTFATKEADAYHIWSIQSPVYVYPLAAFFRTFGTGWVPLRFFCALAAGIGLLFFFRLGRTHRDPWVAPAACVLVALSFFDAQLTRSGLLEPYLNAVLSLTFLAGLLALRSLPWMLLCQAGFAAALLTKQTALFAFPPLVVLGVFAHLRARARGEPAWQHAASLGLAVVLGGGLAAYVFSPAYWQTVMWNFGHMIAGVERHQEVSASAIRLGTIVERLLDGQRWMEGALYIVPLLPLALAAIVRLAVQLVRRRPVEPVELVAAGWLLFALASLQLTGHVRPRFSIVLLPPAAILVACFLVWLARLPRHAWLRPAPFAVALLVVVATDLRWHGSWWSEPSYQIRDGGRELRAQLDRDAVLVGAWAPPLGFDTEADIFYVRNDVNRTKEAIEGLGITHMLLRDRDRSGRYVRRAQPVAWRKKEKKLSFPVLGKRYTLWELPREER